MRVKPNRLLDVFGVGTQRAGDVVFMSKTRSHPPVGSESPGPNPEGAETEQVALATIAGVFLRLGVLGFGGPIAHFAMMEDEIVRRRGWISRARFLELIGVTNLIPGPNSTEVAMLIGRERGGLPGLVIAGAMFITPSAVLVAALAAGYQKVGGLGLARDLASGVGPVMVAIVARSLWALAKTAVSSIRLGVVFVAALAAVVLRVDSLLVLVGAGMVHLMLAQGGRISRKTGGSGRPIAPGLVGLLAGGGVAASGVLPVLFFAFLKIGAILFGSGYVLFALIRAEFVERRGWITETQLLDAVAAGQLTPGPVSTVATFVGWLIAGGAGALVATLGMFLPAFLFTAASGFIVERIRARGWTSTVIKGVSAAAFALMADVAVRLAVTAIVEPWQALVGVGALVVTIRGRINAVWLVLGGGLLGWAVGFLRSGLG